MTILTRSGQPAVAARTPACAKTIGHAEFDLRPLYEPAGLQ